MAYVAGYSTVLKTGGTATSFSNEACTKVTANTVYQITDATKRVLDPATAVVVEVDADGAGVGGYVAGTGYTIDYLTGTVTFAADQGASALVRVSGKYIPTLTIATANNFSLDHGREELDTSAYAQDAASAIQGRTEASGSFDVVEDLLTDHDAGAGVVTLSGAIAAGLPVFVEAQIGGVGNKWRMWALLKGKLSASASDAVKGSLSFTVRNRIAVSGGNANISYAA